MPTSGGIYGYVEAALGPLLVLIALGSSIEIIGLAALIAVSALVYLPQRWIVAATSPT